MTIRRKILATLALGVVLILAACAPATPPPLPETGIGTPTVVIETYAEFFAALQATDADVEATGQVQQPFFPVAGQAIRVDGAEVQVFEFQDEATRRAVSDPIIATGELAGPTVVEWVGQPNFWAEGRLIVLYIGEDMALIDLISDILGTPITLTPVPGAPPAAVTPPEVTPDASVTPGTSDDLPPAAVISALFQLARELGVSTDQIEIVSMGQSDWPDACLGLAAPGEACAQVITPGWQVIVEVGGQQYEVRTDDTGQVVRWRLNVNPSN